MVAMVLLLVVIVQIIQFAGQPAGGAAGQALNQSPGRHVRQPSWCAAGRQTSFPIMQARVFMRRFVIKALAASLLSLAVAGPALAADPAKKQIVIGTTVGDFGDMVKQSVKPILEKQGYAVKLVEFTDYVRPMALQEGAGCERVPAQALSGQLRQGTQAEPERSVPGADCPAGHLSGQAEIAQGCEGGQHHFRAERSVQLCPHW
jgi:hypothetical protein